MVCWGLGWMYLGNVGSCGVLDRVVCKGLGVHRCTHIHDVYIHTHMYV